MAFASLKLPRAVFWSVLSSFTMVALAGCHDRPVHEYVQTYTPDAGATGGAIVATGGTVGVGGRSGQAGSPGLGGMLGGTGGSGACVPTGHETCGDLGVDNDCDGDANDVDPDQLTGVANCGACFNLCNQANAENIQCLKDTATDVVGCHYTCLAGFKDTNGDPKDGCECQIAAAVEVCNGRDDNCNNVVDEGFDLMTDTSNCGRCGVTCSYPFARAACTSGVCGMGLCLAGFFDANGKDSDGCECQKTNGGVEVCDGIDNNCNGVVDEPTALTGAPTCRNKGICAGVTATCHGAQGWSCDYPAGFQQVEDMSKGCDGKDNDCDGLIDEAYDIGKACQVGTGPCAGTGMWACDTATNGRKCNGAMKTPQPEICNGLDDDCDGKVDEMISAADRTTDDKIVTFTSTTGVVNMFAYEATRYDASATTAGVVTNHRPCSVPGKVPWANVTSTEAAAACALIGTGWRLCTSEEWRDACNGTSNTDAVFPYGATFNPTACVGYNYTTPAPTGPKPTGTATMCVSTVGAGLSLYDMSGNVKEWTSSTATPPAYDIHGGAYDIASFTVGGTGPDAGTKAPGLMCDASTPAPKDTAGNPIPVRLPSVGFRCCKPGAF